MEVTDGAELATSGALAHIGAPPNGASLLSQVLVEGGNDDRRESPAPPEFDDTAFEPEQRRYEPFTGPTGSRPPCSLADRGCEIVNRFGNGTGVTGNGPFDLVRTIEAAPVAGGSVCKACSCLTPTATVTPT